MKENGTEDVAPTKNIKKAKSRKPPLKDEYNWWEGETKVAEGKYQGGISVYACQSDTTHPKVLQLALGAGLITKERYEVLTNSEKGVKPILDKQELTDILEHYFGFYKGMCDEDECHAIQTTRFGNKVAGEYRYMGEERMDKDWCSSGLASQAVMEKVKYGSLLAEVSGSDDLLDLDNVFGG